MSRWVWENRERPWIKLPHWIHSSFCKCSILSPFTYMSQLFYPLNYKQMGKKLAFYVFLQVISWMSYMIQHFMAEQCHFWEYFSHIVLWHGRVLCFCFHSLKTRCTRTSCVDLWTSKHSIATLNPLHLQPRHFFYNIMTIIKLHSMAQKNYVLKQSLSLLNLNRPIKANMS